MIGYAAIGLYAPKTRTNVGGAMRAAGCYGASLIVIEGARYRREPEDTQCAWRFIPVLHGPLNELVPMDCIKVVVELCDRAKPLTTFTHPDRAFYIFGPEDGSVPGHVIAKAQCVVQVPTRFCMNLAATVNVVLYDRMLKRAPLVPR